jgi:hypothetical protein
MINTRIVVNNMRPTLGTTLKNRVKKFILPFSGTVWSIAIVLKGRGIINGARVHIVQGEGT